MFLDGDADAVADRARAVLEHLDLFVQFVGPDAAEVIAHLPR